MFFLISRFISLFRLRSNSLKLKINDAYPYYIVTLSTPSKTINYELEFDFFTKEFKGFTIFIDKNTYVNTEINGDHLLHCDQ